PRLELSGIAHCGLRIAEWGSGRVGAVTTTATVPGNRMSKPAFACEQPAIRNAQRAPESALKDYLALTKPRVISLLLLTTLAAMFIAAAGATGPGAGIWLYLAVGLGLYMAAGAANAINMVLERDLDLRMGRTAHRPTVTNRIPATAALRFAFVLMFGSFAILWYAANMLAAMLALAGLAFYVLVFT